MSDSAAIRPSRRPAAPGNAPGKLGRIAAVLAGVLSIVTLLVAPSSTNGLDGPVGAVRSAVTTDAPGTRSDAERPDAAQPGAAGAEQPLRFETRGRWILGPSGEAIGPDSFRRGLQTSGLAHLGGARSHRLLAVGDQRSSHPGALISIDATSGRLENEPAVLELAADTVADPAEIERFRLIPNIDLEGIAILPTFRGLERTPKASSEIKHSSGSHRILAITEDKMPWILVVRVEADGERTGTAGAKPRAIVERIVVVKIPAGISEWRADPNFRLEGVAVSDGTAADGTAADGTAADGAGDAAQSDARVWLAFERSTDDLPRVLEVRLSEVLSRAQVEPRVVDIDFKALPARADKDKARLNLNGLDHLRWNDRSVLIAVARDQERILWIDIERRSVESWIDLDLRDDSGASILWASPEGIAVDEGAGRIFIVTDPDSVQGKYRQLDTEVAVGRYADFVPLLFEIPLAAISSRTGNTANGASESKR
jgi:hypothetical protein